MGIFDVFKDILKAADRPNTPARRSNTMGSRAPPPPKRPELAALEDAQRRRAAEGFERKNGKRATKRNVSNYERLERSLALETGKFPWDDADVQRHLVAKGFDLAHVKAYLSSPAARKLLGR